MICGENTFLLLKEVIKNAAVINLYSTLSHGDIQRT